MYRSDDQTKVPAGISIATDFDNRTFTLTLSKTDRPREKPLRLTSRINQLLNSMAILKLFAAGSAWVSGFGLGLEAVN